MTIFGIALAVCATPATSVAQDAPQSVESFSLRGTTTIHATPLGSGAFQAPEVDTHDGDTGFKNMATISQAVNPLGSAVRRQANLAIPGKEAARLSASAALTQATPTVSLPLPEPIVK